MVVHNLRMRSVGKSLQTQQIEQFKIKGARNTEQSPYRDSEGNRIAQLQGIYLCIFVFVWKHPRFSFTLAPLCLAQQSFREYFDRRGTNLL